MQKTQHSRLTFGDHIEKIFDRSLIPIMKKTSDVKGSKYFLKKYRCKDSKNSTNLEIHTIYSVFGLSFVCKKREQIFFHSEILLNYFCNLKYT